MSTMIDFPEKVFPEWGAIAQELVPYLKSLGATKEETRNIIGKVRGRWEQIGMPTVPVPVPASAGKTSVRTSSFDAHNSHMIRHWKLESARTLIALAKFEYRVLSM